ncbi:MAG: glycogen/starch synthase, partial [Bacteroidales bacterium]|nr:glycogen/starch synthase [Bacteroidales bacterium]
MASKYNLLFAVSEYDGIVKTGGLADVAAALAPKMKELGHDVRVFIPAYSTALQKIETTLVATGGA